MDTHVRNLGVAFGTLLASGATLVCCVLPALLVSIGAGAVMVSILSALPQLVWLSENKLLAFTVAGLLLLLGGVMIWRSEWLPCPLDPAAAQACRRVRRTTTALYGIALTAFAIGSTFAFLIPLALA